MNKSHIYPEWEWQRCWRFPWTCPIPQSTYHRPAGASQIGWGGVLFDWSILRTPQTHISGNDARKTHKTRYSCLPWTISWLASCQMNRRRTSEARNTRKETGNLKSLFSFIVLLAVFLEERQRIQVNAWVLQTKNVDMSLFYDYSPFDSPDWIVISCKACKLGLQNRAPKPQRVHLRASCHSYRADLWHIFRYEPSIPFFRLQWPHKRRMIYF